MADRKQIHKPTSPQRERVDDSQSSQDEALSEPEKSTAEESELDDLLDEIDELLESNAEDFVKNYVQKGGQ